MRLVGNPAAPRLVTRKRGTDYTDQMTNWASHRVQELAREELDGFVFKRMSPSSGMARVKVYTERGSY